MVLEFHMRNGRVFREDGPAITICSAQFQYDKTLGVYSVNGAIIGTASEEPEGFAEAVIKYRLMEAARDGA
jgi:hypothetical protein